MLNRFTLTFAFRPLTHLLSPRSASIVQLCSCRALDHAPRPRPPFPSITPWDISHSFSPHPWAPAPRSTPFTLAHRPPFNALPLAPLPSSCSALRCCRALDPAPRPHPPTGHLRPAHLPTLSTPRSPHFSHTRASPVPLRPPSRLAWPTLLCPPPPKQLLGRGGRWAQGSGEQRVWVLGFGRRRVQRGGAVNGER